jgi:hypothetical protein
MFFFVWLSCQIVHKKKPVIPAEAGIQLINKFPRKWDNIWVLSASQFIFYRWIPASAGMTA